MRRFASLAVAAFVMSGCGVRFVRHDLEQTFSREEARIRSALHPVTVATHEDRFPRVLRMPIDVRAPSDSALIIVLREDVPLWELRQVLGSQQASLLWEWRRRGVRSRATPVVSYFEDDPAGFNVIRSLTVDEISRPSSNFFLNLLDVKRREDNIPRERDIYIVRPGETSRIITKSELYPAGFDEQGRYRTHYEWLTIPAPAGSRLRCGAYPAFVYVLPADPGCANSVGGYASLRDLDSRTRMATLSYGHVIVLALLVAVAIGAIARN